MTYEPDPVEHHSPVEPWIIEHLCVPVLERLPRSVAPNTLSFANHAVCWGVFILAAWSVEAPQGLRAWILTAAGLGVFATMLLDCLDGMQARRTQRASKLGEFIDHGLDTLNVPLLSSSLALALRVEGWILVVVAVTTVMVYHAQLVLYHESGRFVHGRTSGTEAQLGVAVVLVLLALASPFLPPDDERLRVAGLLLVAGSVATSCRLCLYYYRRLGRLPFGHVFFVMIVAGFGVLYLLGSIGDLSFLLLVALASFRLSGAYVLETLLGRSWSGFEPTSLAALLFAFALSRLGFGADTPAGGPILTLGCAALFLGPGLWYVSRELPRLEPTSAKV